MLIVSQQIHLLQRKTNFFVKFQKNSQGNRIKICNFAQVVAYMCYLKMHKTIFSLCFSCHYNF